MGVAVAVRETAATRFEHLLELIAQKKANVGVIGLGYVGLPLTLLFARAGFSATGFDIDKTKVERLKAGQTYLAHIPAANVTSAMSSGRFCPTSDFAVLRDIDAIIICVPTPLDDHRQPDLSYVQATAQAIAAELHPGQLVVLESTTYPGTTEEVVLPILEGSGLRCPVLPYEINSPALPPPESAMDFFLAFSPEREDPGNQGFRTQEVPKVVGGVNGPSAIAAQVLYRQAFKRTVLVSSARTAEMTKLLENIYRCVNIALVNELKQLCQRMDIDIWEVIEAAKTKPFGFSAFYPGPGLGGHCIPVDPFYLSWKAREYDFTARFIELAGEINTAMPERVVEAVACSLERNRKTLSGSRVLVLGAAYKKDVDDMRESPALRIIDLLNRRGARVEYNDPYVPRLGKMRKYNLDLDSVPLSAETLNEADCVLIVTDHTKYDYAWIVRESSLVVDTRNATAQVSQGREKIVRC